MIVAVAFGSPELLDQRLAGRSTLEHLRATSAEAGLTLSEAIPRNSPYIGIDARFPSVPSGALRILTSHLSEPFTALTRVDGSIVAQVLPMGAPPLFQPSDDAPRHSAPPLLDASDPKTRARTEASLRERALDRLIRAGVHVVDPSRTLVDASVTVEPGAVLWPGVILLGSTHVGRDVQVQAGCWLEDTTVGEGAVLRPYTIASHAMIGPSAQVGPFAHLRSGADLGAEVKVGNFVEVKKARLHQGAKASHLSYLGDADIGAGANIGAGTITCNYDGFGKHQTTIGARAFIGSNTALVAPITVGDDAIVGAGSVITQDVPSDAVAVERSSQKNLEGKAPSFRERARRRADREET